MTAIKALIVATILVAVSIDAGLAGGAFFAWLAYVILFVE